jgi:orotate phosphoribosyltransferase
MTDDSTFHDERMPDPRPKAPDAEPDISDRARALANDLLTIGAVALRPEQPFMWSSGLRAPIYCDNRRTLAYPRIRTAICNDFAHLAGAHDLLPATIAGTATAGIPHAAWLADRLHQPMAYVRSEAKTHGRKNQIEGIVAEGDAVIVVEDLISTGGSALNAVAALRSAGAEVRAVLAIFSYELDTAAAAFEDAGIPLHTLTGYRTLLRVAREHDDLSDTALEALRAWRRDPEAWSNRVEKGGTPTAS